MFLTEVKGERGRSVSEEEPAVIVFEPELLLLIVVRERDETVTDCGDR